MKVFARYFSALLLILGGCASKSRERSHSAQPDAEEIVLAIIEHLSTEQRAYALWTAQLDRLSGQDDPLAPPPAASLIQLGELPAKPALPIRPGTHFCVRILGADPSPGLLTRAEAKGIDLLPASAFRKHPRHFASTEDRVAYEYGDMPQLLSLEKIQPGLGDSVTVQVTFYCHKLNAEAWEFELIKTKDRWQVTRRRMIAIA